MRSSASVDTRSTASDAALSTANECSSIASLGMRSTAPDAALSTADELSSASSLRRSAASVGTRPSASDAALSTAVKFCSADQNERRPTSSSRSATNTRAFSPSAAIVEAPRRSSAAGDGRGSTNAVVARSCAAPRVSAPTATKSGNPSSCANSGLPRPPLQCTTPKASADVGSSAKASRQPQPTPSSPSLPADPFRERFSISLISVSTIFSEKYDPEVEEEKCMIALIKSGCYNECTPPVPRNDSGTPSNPLLPHVWRSRSLLSSADRCGLCKRAADWTTSCCSEKNTYCSPCLATGILADHGDCRAHGAIGLIHHARINNSVLFEEWGGQTYYCTSDTRSTVNEKIVKELIQKDIFYLREFTCFDDVHARVTARKLSVLYIVSDDGSLQIIRQILV